MRQTLTSLVLVGMLVASFWPVPGMAEEPLESPVPGGPLQQEAPAAITLSPGFGSFTRVSGLTDPRGLVECPPLGGFPCSLFGVEKSLNRVSATPPGGTPTPFATGLSTPTDLIAPRDGGSPFGNFLYVAESGTSRISRIDNAGAVTTFASLPAPPDRMAFSDVGGGSAFGDLLFVTLADGRIVKVDSAGVVSPCVSGLSGPKGLVFGPGGALRTIVLYVAESTANKISKVDPACTVSSFASTGLTSPVGLAISPAVPWGPLETTLYVVNAVSRVDHVDKNGTVTPFASGFTQADTVHFDSVVPSFGSRLASNLRVSDAAAGTIVQMFVFSPFVTLQLSGCTSCRAGQTFAVSLTLTNNGPISVPVEIKSGFRLFDSTLISASPVSKHFEATLPAGFTTGQLLWLSFPWPTVPAGRYCYEASLTDPEISIGSSSTPRLCFVSQP